MTQFTKPMQPCNANLEKIQFPCIAQRKIDGMKLIIRHDGAGNLEFLGRSMKPITNRWIIDTFTSIIMKHTNLPSFVLEGELQAGGSFESCDGMLSASYREFSDIVYHVFDEASALHLRYVDRSSLARILTGTFNDLRIQNIENWFISNLNDLMEFHAQNDADPALDGTVVRQLDLPYKAGKRTENEGYVLKIKDFADAEAEIIGVVEKMHNGNEAYTNPLGRTERSTAQDGKSGLDTLGALECVYHGGGGDPVRFFIGSFKGLTDEQKQNLWNRKDELLGRLVKFKYMRITKYGVPLHNVFLGFRDIIDLD